MGNLGRPEISAERSWIAVSDVEQLNQAAEAWLGLVPSDPLTNRRFLDRFAIYLVKHFRSEETRLERLQDPGLPWHRGEHRRLVRRIWELMSDEALGLDMTESIQGFLEAWRIHQEAAAYRPGAPGLSSHH